MRRADKESVDDKERYRFRTKPKREKQREVWIGGCNYGVATDKRAREAARQQARALGMSGYLQVSIWYPDYNKPAREVMLFLRKEPIKLPFMQWSIPHDVEDAVVGEGGMMTGEWKPL